MRGPSRYLSLVLAGVAVLGFVSAGRMHASLRGFRESHQLAPVDPLESMPPLVAFTTVAFGGFRGVIADMLWMRASTLQQEGKYFELVQLADWITKLQPRFASIWAYHAWNLSYNISVMFDDPADRWRWVRSGITLLRDEGLRYNPGNADLYRELAWLYFHKMGGDADDAHVHYKREWAREMERLFVGPTPDVERLMAAPATRSDLLAEPGVAELVQALREAGFSPFSFRLFESDPLHGEPEAEPILQAHPEPARLLRDHLRRVRLIQEYRIDPEQLREVEQLHGPLDWRLPQAHAIYWAVQGRPFARTNFGRVQMDRMVFQAMADAFVRGRLTKDAERGIFILRPNLDLLPRVRAVYEESVEEHPEQDSIRVAHENFLVDAIMVSVSYNRMREAGALYRDLVTRYPSPRNQGGFDAFVARTYAEFMGRMGTPQAMLVVESALTQSFFWEALGESNQAAGYAQLAQLCWESFMAQRRDDETFLARTGLPPLSQIRARARERAQETLEALARQPGIREERLVVP